MKPLIDILVVEDSPDDVELIARTLRTATFGCTLRRVETEEDYLTELAAHRPDIVLCDYHLPRFDCLKAMALLAKHRPNTPLIVVSHNIGEDAAVEALRNGAADYVMKGRLGKLGKAIETALEQERLHQENDAAQEALTISEAHKRSILNTLHMRVALLDQQGIILAVNKAWEAFDNARMQAGVESSIVGTNYFANVRNSVGVNPLAPRMLAGMQKVLAHEEPVFSIEHQFSLLGKNHWYVMRAMPLEDGVPGIVVVHEDVTSRVLSHVALDEANQRLQLLSNRVLSIQEDERRSISRELHDDLGQSLTALKLGLHALEQTSSQNDKDKFRECLEIAGATLDKVRQMSLNLHPPQLDQLGIVDTLHWLVERQARQTGIAIEFSSAGIQERLPANIELACYRIAQEGLNNAARHAQAKKIMVSLVREGKQLKLLIQDDGIGFDPEAAHTRALQQGSLGLISMEERADLAGGWLQLYSQADNGTQVMAIFPLSELPANQKPVMEKESI